MSDGMSDYWRAKRRYEKELTIRRDFYLFVTCLLESKPTPRIIQRDINRIVDQIFETMVIK